MSTPDPSPRRERAFDMTTDSSVLMLWTESSVYEVNRQTKLIRRTMGMQPPTDRVGVGWKPFHTIHVEVGSPAEILWQITPGGVMTMTITSNIVAIESLPSTQPGQ
jgi:hypothetical protein